MPNPPHDVPPQFGGAVPPQNYPQVPPPAGSPSGDYSYTLEVVMGMQSTLGKLTEAVDQLKAESRNTSVKLDQIAERQTSKIESLAAKHGEKLEAVAKDIHGARVIGMTLAVVGTFIGFIITIAVNLLSKK